MTLIENIDELVIDKPIACRYKGRRLVEGVLTKIESKKLTVKLTKDYIGANEVWEVDHYKVLNYGECKKLRQ